MSTIRLTMAQALVRFLDHQYVRRDGVELKVFAAVVGIFGHGNVLGVGQALEEAASQGGMPYIQGHNEQGMVHMATAFAKERRRLQMMACTSSVGPGALNMITAAATATVNRIPVLLLPGDVFACRQPDPVLQQLESTHDYTESVNDAFRPVSRYWDRLTRPEQLLAAMRQAMRVLLDPADTGAVTICLPQDVQTEAFDYPASFFHKRVHDADRTIPAASALTRATAAVVGSRRPLIVCGGGVRYSQAEEELASFAEEFRVPIVETQAGKGALAWDHSFNMGAVGVTGSQCGNRLAAEADLIVAIGSRLTDFTTSSKTIFQNPDVKFVGVNVSGADAMKLDATQLVCDAREGIAALGRELRGLSYQSLHTLEELAGQKAVWNAEVNRLHGIVHPDGVAQTALLGLLNELLPPSAIIVCAAGSLPGDLHRIWKVQCPGTYHMEYGFSCMGYEIAGALGVKHADPQREVYVLVGDGSYLMLHSELITSLQENRKITVVLFNNSGYQCIHDLQKGHGSPGFGNEFRFRSLATGLLNGAPLPIDFAAHAESLGAIGLRANSLEQARAAVAIARRETRTTVIDVRVAPGTGTTAYGAWWRVDVPQVSATPTVMSAREDFESRLKDARFW
ncbi:MAG: 3D-(3,5/4)-trihydroxycyclohexane-1,2-dione acylhydrolase (decyclizing) [Bacilli bacterium]